MKQEKYTCLYDSRMNCPKGITKSKDMCIKCLLHSIQTDYSVYGMQAEIAELKGKLKNYEDDIQSILRYPQDQLVKAKDTIARRNKQIADLSSKLKKQQKKLHLDKNNWIYLIENGTETFRAHRYDDRAIETLIKLFNT